MATSCPIFVA